MREGRVSRTPHACKKLVRNCARYWLLDASALYDTTPIILDLGLKAPLLPRPLQSKALWLLFYKASACSNALLCIIGKLTRAIEKACRATSHKVPLPLHFANIIQRLTLISFYTFRQNFPVWLWQKIFELKHSWVIELLQKCSYITL